MKKFVAFMRKRHHLALKLLIILIVLIVSMTLLFRHVKGNVLSIVLTMCEASVKSTTVDSINLAASEVLDATVDYDSLVSVILDSNGDVQFVKIDSLRINTLVRSLADKAQQHINLLEESTVPLPLGAFTGSLVLSPLGPNIDIGLLPIGSVVCDYTSIFESVGINNTRHSIYANINASVSLVLPVSSVPIYVTTAILLCESIIVGKVPDVYLNGNVGDGVLDLVPSQ